MRDLRLIGQLGRYRCVSFVDALASTDQTLTCHNIYPNAHLHKSEHTDKETFL